MGPQILPPRMLEACQDRPEERTSTEKPRADQGGRKAWVSAQFSGRALELDSQAKAAAIRNASGQGVTDGEKPPYPVLSDRK